MHYQPIYDENTKDESPQRVDRLKQLNKVFLYFITTSQSQRFLISTKQDTEHMHQSCQSGYNMEKVKLRFCCLTITKKKMSQRKGWKIKHIKTRHCYIIEKWPLWYSFASLTWSFYLVLYTNNPFGKGDFTQNYEISVGIWKSASEFSLFYLGE